MHKRWEIVLICCLLLPISLVAQIEITTDRSNATYTIGETVIFQITATSTGFASYTIAYDDKTIPLTEGNLDLVAGEQQNISFQLNEAGIIVCSIKQGELSGIAAASFDPLSIRPITEEPADFDAFWDRAKAELAEVPIDADSTYYLLSRHSRAYRLNLGHIDGRRVWGYVTVPEGPGPFPGVVEFPPAGSAGYLAQQNFQLAELGNFLAVSISIHNVPPEEIDPNSYEPNVVTNPDSNYYKYAVLAGVRAIDYLYSRSDFNQEDIAVMGFSQGGGLAMMVAGVDDRVDVLASSIPSHCQHAGIDENKASGFPYYLQRYTGTQRQIVRKATSYYENSFFVKRFKGPSWVFLNYIDMVCPAATGFSAFNNLEGPKILLNTIDLDHNTPAAYFDELYSFFRRHIPATREAPAPRSTLTEGYHIDAGNTIGMELEAEISLNGQIIHNDRQNHLSDIQWHQLSGPGSIYFSDSTAYNPTIKATQEGTYLLQLRAFDYEVDADLNQFYTLIDQVVINVCTDKDGDGICSTMECDDNNAINTLAAGASCDDGNPDTEMDIIQENSCNCEGTVMVIDTIESVIPIDTMDMLVNTDTTTTLIEIDSTDLISEPIEQEIDTLQDQTNDLDSIPLLEVSTDCVDQDEDGICAAIDCNDRDPSPCTEGILFPNPAREKVFLNLEAFSDKTITISVYDVAANRLIYQEVDKVTSPLMQLDLERLVNGIYWVVIKTKQFPQRTEKLVISRLY